MISIAEIPLAGHNSIEIMPQRSVTVPPYTTTNTIFFGKENFLIIDPGTSCEDEQQKLSDYIDARLRKDQCLIAVCLTHHHDDHSHYARALSEHYRVPIYAHPQTQEHASYAITPLIDQQPISSITPILLPLFTPGHCVDHVAYFAPESGILCAGDLITDKGTTLVVPRAHSLINYLSSLEALLDRNIHVIVPAHGDVIRKNSQRFLLTALRHRYLRIAAVLNLIKTNGDQLNDEIIVENIYRGHVNDNIMFFARLSVVSSLQWLCDVGFIKQIHAPYQFSDPQQKLEERLLLNRLKELDERLRNT